MMAKVNPRAKGMSVPELPVDPVESAKIAGLRYVNSNGPGIGRRRAGKGFIYIGVDSRPIRDREVIRRIQSLVIPPAWQDVWICPVANGHLQAVGRDAKGRKQYRYHPEYREIRNKTKFTRMAAFGAALPRIREQVEQDLSLRGLPKRKVLAVVVRLLETTCMRIGNDEYAKQNNSFGLTTLRNRHVQNEGRTLRFKFRGKSGQVHDIELKDYRLARLIQQMQDLPGYQLFEYVDDDGRPAAISSEDVNEYLKEITGEDFTAKDFRTWVGTGIVCLALEKIGCSSSATGMKRNIVAAIKSTAARLGNRPAVCRKYYLHPAVFRAYEEGTLLEQLSKSSPNGTLRGLRREELAVAALVKEYDDLSVATEKKAA